MSIREPYNLSAAFLNLGKVSAYEVVENNSLDHSMLILALQIEAEQWVSS